MTVRWLPPSEWHKLAGTELGEVWAILNPEHTKVCVVEHEGEILGCWSLTTCVHVEGLWIHPEHRGKAAVGRRLYSTVMRAAKDEGARMVLTQAADPAIAALVETAGGTTVPGALCLMPVEGIRCQP